MTIRNDGKKLSQEHLQNMIYMKLLELELKFDLLDAKVESLQQDISKSTLVRSELIKLRFDHKTNELYITEFFKIPFEGNVKLPLSRTQRSVVYAAGVASSRRLAATC